MPPTRLCGCKVVQEAKAITGSVRGFRTKGPGNPGPDARRGAGKQVCAALLVPAGEEKPTRAHPGPAESAGMSLPAQCHALVLFFRSVKAKAEAGCWQRQDAAWGHKSGLCV